MEKLDCNFVPFARPGRPGIGGRDRRREQRADELFVHDVFPRPGGAGKDGPAKILGF